MLLHQDLYIAAGIKMVETRYQHKCNYSEVTKNVFCMHISCSIKTTDIELEISSGKDQDMLNFPLRFVKHLQLTLYFKDS